MSVRVVAVETPALGDRSYLVTDGAVAAAVDPQRDIDRMLALADGLGVRITHVAETHLHNDYLTGGLALARETGADYLVPAGAEVQFERHPAADGELITIGAGFALRVIATPGHTFHHVAYALADSGRPAGVFTGGSLLFGSVGRTDLVAPAHTAELARAQYASARRLDELLPGAAALYPTHGFGSFCSVGSSEVAESTLAAQRQANPALTHSEADFVAELLAGLDAYPAYYAHMGGANAAGPAAPDLSPPEQVDPAEVRRRVAAGEWVVDLRHRVAFAAGHLAGTLNFGLDGKLATYLGWLIPWGSRLTLLGEDAGQVAEAQRELARIGIDRPSAAVGAPGGWEPEGPPRAFGISTFTGLAAHREAEPDAVILDVRRVTEWAASHVEGAVHIPLHELSGRLGDVPAGVVWVHCAGGYRAAIAASLLDAAGREVVAVDDDYDPNAASAGLPLTAQPPG